MFFCSELDANDVCVSWVEISDLFLLPEGAGLQIGGALFLACVTAWGIKQVARLILNR